MTNILFSKATAIHVPQYYLKYNYINFRSKGVGCSPQGLLKLTEQETRKRWDRNVDCIVCGNPPAKWGMHSVTVLHVQSHDTCRARGMATRLHHPQLHNRSDISVLRY